MTKKQSSLPIGVFDSGVGGLTVLKELIAVLPQESFIYLGDTARVPYGTKSAETVCRYSIQVCQKLIQSGIKMLVVACNTASSLALPALQQHFRHIPIIGVLEPSANTAAAFTKNNHIAVIATEATIAAEGYQKAILNAKPQVRVTTQACGLFVSLVEEGFHQDAVAEQIAKRYLLEIFSCADAPDTLILGCTHFPLLAQTIQKIIPPNVNMIDSAIPTSSLVADYLQANDLIHCDGKSRQIKVYVTDSPRRFRAIADRFIAMPLEIELIDIGFAKL